MSRRLASILIASIAVAALAEPAPAQTRVDFGPVAGLFLPLLDPGRDLWGPAGGLQGRLWVRPRFGAQLQVTWAYSRVGGGPNPGGYDIPSISALVMTATAQAIYRVPLAPRGDLVWFGGGVGLVRREGHAYASYGDPMQFAPTLSVGRAVPIGGRLCAIVGLTTALYWLDIRDSTGMSYERGFQVDPLFHVALSWGWP